MRPALAQLAIVATMLLMPALARADEGWFTRFAAVKAGLASGGPMVVHVIVPLCNEAHIRCGGGRAGAPRDLERNLYWGAIFGARRFADRPRSPFTRKLVGKGDGALLERVVYRRELEGGPLGAPGKKIEQLLVLDAYDGDAIDLAVGRFVDEATGASTLPLGNEGAPLPVAAVVYAGHNRMMDGLRPQAAKREGAPASVVLACDSEPYFGPLLRGAGGVPLLTTRALMAPEGYLVESVAISLGLGESEASLRARAIDTGTSWWKLARTDVAFIFAPFKAPS